MKLKSRPFFWTCAAALPYLCSTHFVAAAVISWDDAVGDNLWSSNTNWSDDADPSGDDLTFNSTGVDALGTTTNRISSNTSVNSITWVNTGGSASAHTTEIDSGATLTVNGTISPSITVNNLTTASSVSVAFKGSGTFSVTGGSTVNFHVGQTNLAAAGSQTLDMSALANFSANVGAMNLGNGQRNSATVTLANSNNIVATSLTVGGHTTTGGSLATLKLGTTNIVASDTINIGNGRTSANWNFNTGLTAPTLTLTNRAGSGGANVNIGLTDTNASGGPVSSVDFSAGTIIVDLGVVTIGRSANGTAGGSGSGTLTFGAGTLNANTFNVGNGNTGTSATATGIGVVNMTTSSGTLTATTVNLGRLTSGARNNDGNGTFNQNGGVAVITSLVLADGTGNTGSGDSTGTYNLAGGTLRSSSIQPGTAGTGTGVYTRTFNWTGGTIQNLNTTTNLTIASGLTIGLNGAGTKTFAVDSGRTISVNGVLADGAAAGGFTKSNTGTLTLAGTNTYTGATTVSAGTLLVTGALGNTTVTVESAGTIGGSGALAGNLVINAGGNLDVTGGNLTTGSGLLTVDSAKTISLNDFSFTDIVGWDASTAADGTYTLINGGLSVTFGGSTPLASTPFAFSATKFGYFQQGSLQAVVYSVPETSAVLLGAIGVMTLLRRRRA